MPYQPTKTLTAFIMEPIVKEVMKTAPSVMGMGMLSFGSPSFESFKLMLVCLDGYIKGAAIGYTFRDKYDLLVPMMVKPKEVEKYKEHLRNVAQKRVNSHKQEPDSIIDFFILTELSKDKLTFDDFLEKAKKRVKIDSAGPRIKLIFEEGTSFGSNYPEMVSKLISLDRRASSLDWEKAKLYGHRLDINALELDLEFLKKWAKHNLKIYATECFPELLASLKLEGDE